MFRRYTRLYLLLVVILIGSCTTRKDGFSYRTFHNTTARYNGYFYAKESMKEARALLKERQKDDYDEVLPVFIYGAEADAQAIFPLMERAIEKSSRVIERHKMEPAGRTGKKMKRPEMNRWIDDNYLLIGQGYFYKRDYLKAEEMFLYVSRKYKEKEMQALSNAWLARTYMQRDMLSKAKNAILKAVQLRDLKDQTRVEVHLVYADFLIRQENWKEAAEQVEYALRYIKKKRDKARPTFILAQLNQRQDKSQEAIAMYNSVLKLRPEYEMAFYSKIMQAMAFDRRGGNSARIKEILYKLLRDEKNTEYQDQIYYALAEIELEEQNRNQGIDYLKSSVATSVDNQRQKTKSFLRLADLHLEDKKYPLAQAYYDSTFRNIEEKHPRYNEVKNKAESLTELVFHLNIIESQDSLASICDLSEEDRIKKLKKIRRQLEEERDAAIRAAEAAAAKGSAEIGTGAGTFWPYNAQLRVSGQRNFIQYWGDRKLEDNWRRKNKMSMSFGESEEEVAVEEVVEEVVAKDEIPSIDEMLAALPCSEEDRLAGTAAISEAYYQSGVIYREKLDDLENAIEQWEVLVTRFDDSEFHPTSFYLLFRTYLLKESEGYQNPFCGTCSSRHWGDIILERYPGTEFALLVENPDYLDVAEITKQEERAAYEALLPMYYNRSYQELLLQTAEVIQSEPDNHLICKYKLLNAQATGGMDAMLGMRENYIKALEKIITDCPGSEEAAYADEKLKILRNEIAAETQKTDEATAEEPKLNVTPFTYDAAARHYFMIVLPLKDGDVNQVKAQLSDFATASFKSLGLKVSSNLIDRNNQVVLVKTFNRLEDATAFLAIFKSSPEMEGLRQNQPPTSLISKENYVSLFKNKDLEGYQTFFQENYQP